jgi:hypothetical protein
VPLYIDCNPRLVEPMNALFAEVDLAGLLVAVSLGGSPAEAPASRPGVRTHMAGQGLAGCALRGGGRAALLAEAWRLWRRRGPYAGSREELTPVGLDAFSLLPLAYFALRLFADPGGAARLTRQVAQAHQLNPAAVRIIRETIEAVPPVPG